MSPEGFDVFDEETTAVGDIVSIGKSVGLGIDDEDVQEPLDEHRSELIELSDLQIEEIKMENSLEDEQVREEATISK